MLYSNDEFDKFTRKMINENIQMSNPESYEGIYFKSNQEYVKYMKSKHTAKVETLNIDKLCQKLSATFPRFKRDTTSRLIKTLKIDSDEYKGYEKTFNKNINLGYDNNDIDLFEFVVERRLKEILKSIPQYSRDKLQIDQKHRNITWKQLTQLKQSVAYFLQTQSHRSINDVNYDIKDFQEIDPRSQYNAHDAKYFKEENNKRVSLVKRLKEIVNILRNIMPESKTSEELKAIYADGYHNLMRYKVPPNTKHEKERVSMIKSKSTAKNLPSLLK